MTFVPKTFTSGTALPALSLNEMDANDDHVREEANYYPLMAVHDATYEGSTTTLTVQLYIDGSAIGSAFTTSGDKSAADISLAAVADGVHVLTVQRNSTVIAKTRFYKSPDLDYLTWWVTVHAATGSINPFTHRVSALTVIGHREAKSWT